MSLPAFTGNTGFAQPIPPPVGTVLLYGYEALGEVWMADGWRLLTAAPLGIPYYTRQIKAEHRLGQQERSEI